MAAGLAQTLIHDVGGQALGFTPAKSLKCV